MCRTYPPSFLHLSSLDLSVVLDMSCVHSIAFHCSSFSKFFRNLYQGTPPSSCMSFLHLREDTSVFLATNERVGILSCFWQLRELVTIVGRTSGRNLDGVFVGDPFPETFFAVWITEPCCFQEEDELDICDGVALSRSLPPLSSTWVELDASAALSVTPWSPAFLCVARFLWNSLSQENSNIIDFDGTFTYITETLVDCNALTSSKGPLGV